VRQRTGDPGHEGSVTRRDGSGDVDVVVASAHDDVIDVVLAAAAAMGRKAVVVRTGAGAMALWRRSSALFIGADVAETLAEERPPRREAVYLVGRDAAALGAMSVPLAAEVVVIPEGVPLLAAVLADAARPGGRTVTVIGGSGGVGASTLAVGLAFAARAEGVTSALVDLDCGGGGIDLLVGAERVPGWRWPQLAPVSGRVGDISGGLPTVGGVSLVSMARREPAEVRREPVTAVLGSLVRHHDLVVVDPGRMGLGCRP
jgi:secretion/DNA translocation related CpaE-like protein